MTRANSLRQSCNHPRIIHLINWKRSPPPWNKHVFSSQTQNGFYEPWHLPVTEPACLLLTSLVLSTGLRGRRLVYPREVLFLTRSPHPTLNDNIINKVCPLVCRGQLRVSPSSWWQHDAILGVHPQGFTPITFPFIESGFGLNSHFDHFNRLLWAVLLFWHFSWVTHSPGFRHQTSLFAFFSKQSTYCKTALS